MNKVTKALMEAARNVEGFRRCTDPDCGGCSICELTSALKAFDAAEAKRLYIKNVRSKGWALPKLWQIRHKTPTIRRQTAT